MRKKFAPLIIEVGRSAFNNKRIAALVTCGGNSKLGDGNIIQLSYIPYNSQTLKKTITSGGDETCCVKTCAHRWVNFPDKKDMCYVYAGFHSRMALAKSFDAIKTTPVVGLEEFTTWLTTYHDTYDVSLFRVGRFGDPASMPQLTRDVLLTCQNQGIPWTGYTAAWRDPKIRKTFDLLLAASTTTMSEANDAIGRGWATTYLSGPVTPAKASVRTLPCPAEDTGVKCEDCRLCGTNIVKTGKHATSRIIHITPHGQTVPFKRKAA